MADRYDDSYPRRPIPGTPAPRRAPAGDDPLVELARIVSDKSSFDDIISGRETPRGRGAAHDSSFDLESELLNDLQASFDPPRPAPRPPAPPVSRATPTTARPAAPKAPQNSYDHMQIRSGNQGQWTASAHLGHAHEDEDPYAGTPYAAAGYERAPQPAASRASAGRDPRRAEPAPQVPSYPGYDQDPYDSVGYQADGYDGTFEQGGAYDEHGHDHGHDDDGYEPVPKKARSRKGLIVAAAVLGVVLAGGLAAVAMKPGASGGSGGPAVIAADDTPTKIKPAAKEPEQAPEQNKLIYDRVASEDPSGEQLVVPDDGPVDEAPAVEESAGSREISRIILPGGPGGESATPAVPEGGDGIGAVAAADAPAAPVSADPGPRKVRTVVVRPDGTIISSEAQPRDGSGNTQADVASASPAASASELSKPVTDPAPMTTAAKAPEPVAPPPAAEPPKATEPAAAAKPVKDNSQLVASNAPAKPAAPKPRQAEEAPIALPEARPAPVASAPAPAPEAAPAPSAGGFVVQVSSQRTEDQARAAYASLQKKYPSVLGGRAPNIARADLGEKGIYYRARVGPMSTRDEAVSFCENLRAAGGTCIVQKN